MPGGTGGVPSGASWAWARLFDKLVAKQMAKARKSFGVCMKCPREDLVISRASLRGNCAEKMERENLLIPAVDTRVSRDHAAFSISTSKGEL